MRKLLVALAAVVLLPPRVGAQVLRVLDIDAHLVSDTEAGALFDVDATAPTNAEPAVFAAADLGAPFEFLSGIAISPLDGTTAVADLGSAATGPRIVLLDCGAGVRELVSGPPLSQPFGLAFLPDGRLVVADAEADPSGLGPDELGGQGHGALFVVDPACRMGCAPALLSDGSVNLEGLPSVFNDPFDVAYDPVSGLLLVVDLGFGSTWGAPVVRGVDPATGAVTLVGGSSQWVSTVGVGVRPDGTPLVVDEGYPGDSWVWELDLSVPDPMSRAVPLTGGTQYAQLQDVACDASDRVVLVDWGEYDPATQTFIVPPAIWRVDAADGNPRTNGRLVNDSVELLTPVGIAFVGCTAPPPRMAINRAVTPRSMALVRAQFDPTCVQAPWTLCPEEILPGALDGFWINDEGGSTVRESLRFYQHSDPTTTMKVRKSGFDLIFSAS